MINITKQYWSHDNANANMQYAERTETDICFRTVYMSGNWCSDLSHFQIIKRTIHNRMSITITLFHTRILGDMDNCDNPPLCQEQAQSLIDAILNALLPFQTYKDVALLV